MRHLSTLLLTNLILSACSHNGTSFVVEKPVGGKSTTSFNTNLSSGSGSNTVTINTGSGSATTVSSPLTPVTSTPVTSTPVTSTPVTSTPVTSTPVTSTPVTSTPVTSTPVTSTPVTSTPVTSTPVTSTPVTSTPVTSTPITSTPIAPHKLDEWFKPDSIIATPVQASFVVAPPEARLAAEVQKVIEETNKIRAERGLPPLVYDASLTAHAQRRAEEIVEEYRGDHRRPNGDSPYTGSFGSGTLGENIAAGQPSAQHVVDAWRNSSGHYKNMISSEFTKIGVGIASQNGGAGGFHWVQTFGSPNIHSQYRFDSAGRNKPFDNISTHDWVHTSPQSGLEQFIFINGLGVRLNKPHQTEAWQAFHNSQYQGVLHGGDNLHYGLYQTDHNDYKAFIHGTKTTYAQMPSSGSAVYQGTAAISDGQNVNTNLTSHLKANFSDKQLTGALAENGEKVIGIQAHIKGSHFYSPEQASVQTEGAFYGSHADAVGGMFLESSTGKYGTFGAKKQ